MELDATNQHGGILTDLKKISTNVDWMIHVCITLRASELGQQLCQCET